MSFRPKVEMTFSNRTIFRVLTISIGTLITIHFIRSVAHVLELIFVAFFLSLALNPAVSWISRHLKLKSRAAATGIAYLAVIVLLGLFMSLVVPPLVKETVDFVRQVPTTLSSLNSENTTAGRFVQKYHLQENVDGLSQNIRYRTKNLQQPVITTAT
ncbi:AI-2E family transporter, partial [Candidatus Saccharibacteria bacterium]|nr:AI-2E family transporter [Candidatus Saccharibacteria bacterium]